MEVSAGAILICLYVFTIACFNGFDLISKVPTTLHTPLMSGSNAISGITIVGALLTLGSNDDPIIRWLAFAGLVFAAINVFGGYAVTDRMLKMFKRK